MGSSPTGGDKNFLCFKFYFCRGKTKITTPCGIQTHNLQIRSLTRCSIAPTGQAVGSEETAPFGLCAFLGQKKGKLRMLQEGLEPPTLGLLDPCSTKLSYQSCCSAHARDRTKDLQIFSLTLYQLSYMGVH